MGVEVRDVNALRSLWWRIVLAWRRLRGRPRLSNEEVARLRVEMMRMHRKILDDYTRAPGWYWALPRRERRARERAGRKRARRASR